MAGAGARLVLRSMALRAAAAAADSIGAAPVATPPARRIRGPTRCSSFREHGALLEFRRNSVIAHYFSFIIFFWGGCGAPHGQYRWCCHISVGKLCTALGAHGARAHLGRGRARTRYAARGDASRAATKPASHRRGTGL